MEIDLFSEPFQFRFGKSNNSKRTTVGTLTSFLVVALSLIYLAYLIYQFATNSLQPTIVNSQNSVTMINQTLEYSPIMFKYNVPPAIQNNISSYFLSYSQQAVGTEDGANLTIVSCSKVPANSKYTGYYCIDPASADQLYVDDEGNYNQIYVRGWMCQGAQNNCTNQSNIQTVMKNRKFSIEVLVAYFEFNQDTSTTELKYSQKNIPGDTSLVSWQVISLKQTVLALDKGFLLSSYTYHNYISGFTSDIIPLEQSFCQPKYGLSAPIFMQFEIRMELSQVAITVQYIKFSTLLAMFSAIFSVLLNLGLLGKMTSKAMIYQEMVDNFIREYYRETAHALMDQSEHAKKPDLKRMASLSEKEKRSERAKIINQNLLAADGELKAMFQYYKGYSAKDASSKVQSQGLETIDREEIHRRVYQRLPDQMNARLLYNEIYSLKTAMQVLYTPEQYAALKYLGRRLYDNNAIDDIDKYDLNHIEKLDVIEENNTIREHLVHEFIIKQRKSPSNDPIDKKIWESMLKYVKNEESDAIEQVIENIDRSKAAQPSEVVLRNKMD